MNLLEKLTTELGLSYLSDLKSTDKWRIVVQHTPHSDHTIREWNEAITYLCTAPRIFTSPEEARKYLLEDK